ncbi:MAG: hypothetical protein AAB356_01425 [Deltaproteobacteria bacterium]
MKTMICPYLEHGAANRVCNASVTLMKPDDRDTVQYCSSEEHYRCPLLLAHVLRGNRSRTLRVAGNQIRKGGI